jgi:RNA polymerase sigma-70 factor, ECF subfamily
MGDARDAELLGRARGGDADAFSALVRRHDRFLYRAARSVLRDEVEAEDVVQQTFLRAFTKLAKFRGDASLRTWLTRIALNDAIRRRRERRLLVELGELDTATERARSDAYLSGRAGFTPEAEAARSQVRNLLERAIDELPPALRTILIMRDVEDASVDETASVLGIKPETVRTRLHRARSRLRETLGTELGTKLKDVFPFDRPRCDALVDKLLVRAGLQTHRSTRSGTGRNPH